MSLSENQEKCAVCHAYLFEDDDTVYCPECGAPHHRSCYNAVGHCGLEELHGTKEQYKKAEPKAEEPHLDTNLINCGMCGEKYERSENTCPNCNTPNVAKGGSRFISFDFLGGVPAQMDLGDGVTAEEAKKFVLSNTHRYIPKFAAFNIGKKLSWNWMAFLTPCGWLLSRKMYLLGSIIGALQIAFTMLLMPFNQAINFLDFSAAKGYFDYSNIIAQNIDKIDKTVILVALLGTLFELVLRIAIATFGDLIYRNRVISGVKAINSDTENDKIESFRKKGGINIFIGALGYFAVSELPAVIAMLTGII